MVKFNYPVFVQSGTITNVTANASSLITFPHAFGGVPNLSLTYANSVSSTLCYSGVSTGSFTLIAGLAGTVSWIGIYNTP